MYKKRFHCIFFYIKRIRPLIDEKTALMLYFSFIHSHLSYLSTLYGTANKTDLISLFVLQKKALKFIKNECSTFPSLELFSEKVLPFSLVEHNSLILAFKIKRNLIKCPADVLTVNEMTLSETRRRNDFYIKPYKSKFSEGKFFIHGLRSFNNLNPNLKSISTFRVFKNKTKELLYNNFLEQ